MGWYRLRALCLFGVALAACGGSGSEKTPPASESAKNTKPSGTGVCALLMQHEVDELFGTAIGFGANETLEEGDGGRVELCSWPADGDPALLVQVSPANPDILAAVDLGEGFRTAELSGLSGPAAVATEVADGNGAVAVVALTRGERTLVVSPIGLGMTESSPRFERLKELVDAMASRLDLSSDRARAPLE